ncbi:hypothetical protein D3C80_1389360 [compost metagenome]
MFGGEGVQRRLQRGQFGGPFLARLGGQTGGVAAFLIGDFAAALGGARVPAVAQDGEKPGAQIAARLEAGPVRPRLGQGLLHQVVGVGRVPGKGEGEGAQRRQEASNRRAPIDRIDNTNGTMRALIARAFVLRPVRHANMRHATGILNSKPRPEDGLRVAGTSPSADRSVFLAM